MIRRRDINAWYRKVAQEFRPQRIILFGSCARGTPGQDSDVDVLVVMRLARGQREVRQAAAIRARVPAPFPMDVLVRTPQEISRRLAEGNGFIAEILRHGRLMSSVDRPTTHLLHPLGRLRRCLPSGLSRPFRPRANAPIRARSRRIKKHVDKREGVFTVPPGNMKKNPLIPALIGILAVLTLFGAWAIWNTYIYSKKSRMMQAQTVHINNVRVVMDGLVKNTIEYSKKNPAVDPILRSVKIDPEAARAATR